MFRLLITFVALIALAVPARSDSLLATLNYTGSGGASWFSYTSVEGVAFELGFTLTLSGGPCASVRVGCSPIPVALIGPGSVFEFGPANPNFSAIVAGLTNQTADPLCRVNRFFDANGNHLWAGGDGGGSDLRQLPALSGAQITRIQLVIASFALGPCCQGGGFAYNTVYDWKFYGNAAVPALTSTWGRVKECFR